MSSDGGQIERQPLLSLRCLSKRWSSGHILEDISFDVHPHEIFCILGPNGSGKTTLLSMLSTTLVPDGGEVDYLGEPAKNLRAARANLGYMSDIERVPNEFTVLDYLTFYSHAYALGGRFARAAVQKALSDSNLLDQRNCLVDELSPTQLRHLCLSRVTMHEPDLLFLDEPLSGLPVEDQSSIIERLEGYVEGKRAVVLSSIDFDEAASVAHRLALLEEGRIQRIGPAEKILDFLETRDTNHE